MKRRFYLTTLLGALSGCGLKGESGSDTSAGVAVNGTEIVGGSDSLSIDARFVNAATEQSPATLRITLANQSTSGTVTISGGGYLPFDTAWSADSQYVLSAVDDGRAPPKEKTRWTGDCWKLDGKAASYPVGVSQKLTAGEQLQTRYHLFALEDCSSGTFEFETDLELDGNSERLTLTVQVD